ncbi:MAG: 50S ribosomal protein L25 [Thermoleophilia bacterium]|nr:50S ribosomal protein L25 [Thermoleophilia bacterium]
MAQHVPLTVSTRVERGSATMRRLRTTGRVPGVLYQPGGDSLAFSADENEVRRLIRRGGIRSAVVDLVVDSASPRTVLFKMWTTNPVRDQITHLDLQEVNLTVEVEADVPVILTGTAQGVRDGGILDQTTLTVRVRALPDALPRSIELDVTDVELGASVHVSDLVAPAGVMIVTEPEHGLASVTITRATLSGEGDGSGGDDSGGDGSGGDDSGGDGSGGDGSGSVGSAAGTSESEEG